MVLLYIQLMVRKDQFNLIRQLFKLQQHTTPLIRSKEEECYSQDLATIKTFLVTHFWFYVIMMTVLGCCILFPPPLLLFYLSNDGCDNNSFSFCDINQNSLRGFTLLEDSINKDQSKHKNIH